MFIAVLLVAVGVLVVGAIVLVNWEDRARSDVSPGPGSPTTIADVGGRENSEAGAAVDTGDPEAANSNHIDLDGPLRSVAYEPPEPFAHRASTVTAELRAWQLKPPTEELWVTTRVAGGNWTAIVTITPLGDGHSLGYSSTAEYRYGDVGIAGIGLRLWQHVGELERSPYSGCIYDCGPGGSPAALIEQVAASVWGWEPVWPARRNNWVWP